jgi:hypothetical protein
LLLWAGCDQGEPPFDRLPLRDALRADPAVLAGLSDEARARLAARFEAARSGDATVDHLTAAPSATPATVVAHMDQARLQRQAEPLLVGVIRQDAAWPIDGDDDRASSPLPPLEGSLAASTAEVEARALASTAGVELRILIAATGARHLVRVVGWPSGAVAIDETIYVNASWLVALAPAERQKLDAGLAIDVQAPSSNGSQGSSTSPAGASTIAAVPLSADTPPSSAEAVTGTVAGTLAPRLQADAGVPPAQAPEASPDGTEVIADYACSTCIEGCANSDGQTCESDASEGEADDAGPDSSCGSPPEEPSAGSSDPCADSGEVDGAEADPSGCQIGPRRKGRSPHPSAWVLAPLVYLFYRRRP